jgi:hypothetical protein
VKRRPRDECVIQRDTHPALINDVIAEKLLTNLGAASAPPRRDGGPSSLLTGLLRAPASETWRGNRAAKAEFYRATSAVGTRSIDVAKVDAAVFDRNANGRQGAAHV